MSIKSGISEAISSSNSGTQKIEFNDEKYKKMMAKTFAKIEGNYKLKLRNLKPIVFREASDFIAEATESIVK